jgi:Family of unknown function (DUF6194)
MDEVAVTHYITDTFVGVETTTAYDYTFFFYSSERKLPFATLATVDNEYDSISNLSRAGVFRLNIGVRKPTFQALFGTDKVDISAYDFTGLDTIMPHPEYAPQSWVCVLSPSMHTFQHNVIPLLAEAYEVAVQRHLRRQPTDD